MAAVQAKAQNTTQRAEAALTQLTAALQQSVDHIDKALGFLKAASGASDASGSTDVGAATAPVPANGAGAGTLAERLSGVASALRASSSKDPVGSRLYNLTSAALDTVLKGESPLLSGPNVFQGTPRLTIYGLPVFKNWSTNSSIVFPKGSNRSVACEQQVSTVHNVDADAGARDTV